MSQVYPLEEELNLLDPAALRFRRDAFQDLILEQGTEEPRAVRVLRGFPYSAVGRMISVFDADGVELGIIPDLTNLDPGSRQLVEAELSQVYFVPRITGVDHIEERFHVPRWQVQTDRGARSFEIRSGNRDVRVEGSRVLIRDADGNHYEIPDYLSLDEASRKWVEAHI